MAVVAAAAVAKVMRVGCIARIGQSVGEDIAAAGPWACGHGGGGGGRVMGGGHVMGVRCSLLLC